MKKSKKEFHLMTRLLHWLMAFLILSMLFIGAGMVSSLEYRPWLLDLHRPLGIAILLLVIIRLFNRFFNPLPPLPDKMPLLQRKVADGTHWIMYGLMLIIPIIGWATLSSGGFPIILFNDILLVPITPVDPLWYSVLRKAHSVLAWLLFLIIIGHLAMAFLHEIVYGDGLLIKMIKGERKKAQRGNPEE